MNKRNENTAVFIVAKGAKNRKEEHSKKKKRKNRNIENVTKIRKKRKRYMTTDKVCCHDKKVCHTTTLPLLS